MYKQLLSLTFILLLAAPLTMAQEWDFQGFFPDDTTSTIPRAHGVAVDSEGKVWVQPFSSTEVIPDCGVATDCATNAVYVFEADGTPASFSPVIFVELPGGVTDTLGGFVNADGAWETRSGRGLGSDENGNILISQFDVLYKVAPDGSGIAMAEPGMGPLTAASGAGGSIFVGPVVVGNPIIEYDSNLEFLGNVTEETLSFNRTLLAHQDEAGTHYVFEFNYDTEFSVVHSREFLSSWMQNTTALQGLSVNSSEVHPTTGQIWVDAGPNCCVLPPPDTTLWEGYTWYGFELDDIMTNSVPTPVESIRWDGAPDSVYVGGQAPRAIAFSPDGMTAYVGDSDFGSPSVQEWGRTIATEDGVRIPDVADLHPNRPNPVSGVTTFSFDLHEAANVTLRVFDLAGRQVALIAEGAYVAGTYSETFDTSGLAAGVYAYTLEIDGQILSRRMTVVR